MTINDSWGYQANDRNFKSARQCIRMLAECAGMGGNLLLDVGPKNDGTITPEQTEVLKGLGRWMRKHGEAVYGTVAGLPPGLFYGASTLEQGARHSLSDLLRPAQWPGRGERPSQRGQARQRGWRTGLSTAKSAARRGPNLPGVLWIDVPEDALDPDATVLKLELDGPLKPYTGAGDVTELNG